MRSREMWQEEMGGGREKRAREVWQEEMGEWSGNEGQGRCGKKRWGSGLGMRAREVWHEEMACMGVWSEDKG